MLAAQPSSFLNPFCWCGSGAASDSLRAISLWIIRVTMGVMVIGRRSQGVNELEVLDSKVVLPFAHWDERVPSQRMLLTTHSSFGKPRSLRSL